MSVTVSLWGANARNTTYNEGCILAIKGARLSDYNGKSLNSGEEHSQIFINPENKRTKELKTWWTN